MRLYRKRRTHLGPRRRNGEPRTDAAIDVDAAVLDPTRYFERPKAVVDDPRLDVEQKRRIQESWALDAQRLSESEDENMPGRLTERPFLREAKLALLELAR